MHENIFSPLCPSYLYQRLKAMCVLIRATVSNSWTITLQAPLSMELSRQEYWRGLPFRPPRDLPDPAIKPGSLGPPASASRIFTAPPPGNP